MKKIIIIISALVFGLVSCTNLDEHLYSQISKDQFLSSPENLALYTSRPYTSLQSWGVEQGYWTLVLQIGNELAVPKSWDGSWGEARYVELQTHEITTSNKLVRTGWEYCFDGISACNDAIFELEKLESTEATEKSISEIKVLRAFYYLLAIDLWGQVPFSVKKDESGYPETKTRPQMFTWIESEITSNRDKLDTTPSAATYGRVTKDVANFVLAKLYLNSEVYTGTAKWAECASLCKDIIESKHFHLTNNYAENFAINNESSSEAIFAIPYSSVYTTKCFYPYVLTLNSDLQKLYNVGDQWNGTHMGQPDFMASYEVGDLRKKATWLFGDIYDASGNRWTYVNGYDSNGNPKVENYSLEDINIDESKFGAGIGRLDGARFIKWPFQSDGSLNSYTVSMENDFILMRYADVVLMYVECLIRQNKQADAALVPDFITIRTRAGLTPMTAADLTLDKFLVERQHEMALEGWVHNDLVRFGKYLNKWWAKPADSKPGYILLPIPEEKRGANPNLGQNEAYL